MDGALMGGKRILLVDHEPQIRDTVAEALAALEVVAIGNVEEARPRIARESFDLVILDTVGADGCNLLKDCHANKLPAAMLTTREIEVKRLNVALRPGVMSFFPKDELQQLPETVAERLERVEKGKKSSTRRLFRLLGSAFRETWRVVWEQLGKSPKCPPHF